MPHATPLHVNRFRSAVNQARADAHDPGPFKVLIPLWKGDDGLFHAGHDNSCPADNTPITRHPELWAGTLEELVALVGPCQCALNFTALYSPGAYLAAHQHVTSAHTDLARLQADPKFVRHQLCVTTREHLVSANSLLDEVRVRVDVLSAAVATLTATLDAFESEFVPRWHTARNEVDTWLWWAASVRLTSDLHRCRLSQWVLRGGSISGYTPAPGEDVAESLKVLRGTVGDPTSYTAMVCVADGAVVGPLTQQCEVVCDSTEGRTRIIGSFPGIVARALRGNYTTAGYRNLGDPLDMASYRFLLESWDGTEERLLDDLSEMARCARSAPVRSA